MDWILIGAIVVAGWAMLSVLSGERLGQAQRAAILLAHAAAEQVAAKDNEIPIARSNEAALVGSPAAFKRKH
jgi:hypothetical protein